MGVRSLGNALASFGYKFGRTGLGICKCSTALEPITATGGDTRVTLGTNIDSRFYFTVEH